MAANITNDKPSTELSLMASLDAPLYMCRAQIREFGVDSQGHSYGNMVPFVMHLGAIILLSNLIRQLLSRFRQPRIVSDILGGMILGPSLPYLLHAMLSQQTINSLMQPVSNPHNPSWLEVRNHYMATMYPPLSMAMIKTFSSLGLMVKLFLIGVKTDPAVVLRTGPKALVIGLASMLLPFIVTAPIAFMLRHADLGDEVDKYTSTKIENNTLLIFVMAAVSTTCFPVLSDLLSEIGLLNTELGRLSISASMINDVIGWIFLSVFGGMRQSRYGALKGIYVTMSFFIMVLFIVFVFRRWMLRIVKNTAKGTAINESIVCGIMFCVFLFGLVSDAIGVQAMTGSILMGLVVPEGPPLGTLLVEKLDLLTSELLMPLVFLEAGMSLDILAMPVLNISSTLQMLMVSSYVLKLVGTMFPALYFKIPIRNAALLGVIMNFRGLIELTMYLDLKSEYLFSTATYTNVIVSSVVLTAICVPLVSIFYDPMKANYRVGNMTIEHLKIHSELRILLSLPDEEAVPAMINILEASCGHQQSPICVYPLHLEDMEGRANSSLIAHKDKKGYINLSNMDRLLNAFINYEQIKKGVIVVQPHTAIAPYKAIHQDICSLAAQKNVALIIMPFPRKDPNEITEAHRTIQHMVKPVLEAAPASLGILAYRAFNGSPLETLDQFTHRINVFFWGGPDDREALSLAIRMARHPGVYTKVIRFAPTNNAKLGHEYARDEDLVMVFKAESDYSDQSILEEVTVDNIEQTMKVIRAVDRDCDLTIVGRRQSESFLNDGLEEWSECEELGVVGDILASSDFDDCSFSVLVLQQPQRRR